ncbi:MAG TPA: hypothetical protein DDW23_04165, partial [Planctomycetes bacterium]|nr:hypothetical protein [Planctomycetota bacterium]
GAAELLVQRRKKFREMASATTVLSRAVAEAGAQENPEILPDDSSLSLPSARLTDRRVPRKAGKRPKGRE